MDAAILALIVEIVGVGSGLLIEADRRRSGRATNRVAAGLQAADLESVVGVLSAARVAGMMRGAMTKKLAESFIESHQFGVLARELLFAVIVEERKELVSPVIESMKLLAVEKLGDAVAPDDASHFAQEFGAALAEACEGIVSQVRQEAPEALADMQQVNLLRRIGAILDGVEKHREALKRSADADAKAARSRFLDDYRVVCAERHGYIVPPDFETNRKIAMEQLYVVPSIEQAYGRPAFDQTTIQFEEFITKIDRTVILGDPGGGKSTMSNYLTAKWARGSGGPVPFHVTLRDFAAGSPEQSVLAYIEQEIGPRYQVGVVEGIIEDLLLTGEAVVVFDGLDELIDTSKRRDVTRAVELFGIRYPLARILVTSRRVGYDQARLDPAIFTPYVIGEFTTRDVRSYVHKWFASQSDYTDQQASDYADGFMSQSESVPDLRSNPLMLALMCIIFRGENFIPRNRPAVYERCANLLFEKWDGHRGIEVPLQARDHVSSAMKYIAYRFLETESGDSGIRFETLVEMLTEYLHPRAVDSLEGARMAAEEFVEYCRGRAWVFTDAGTTASGEPLYKFTHRTFMEYFAAVHLTRITDSPEALANLLLPHVAKEEWDVVAQLAVQKVEEQTDRGTERALVTMLRERRKRSTHNRGRVLRFVARCTQFAIISPALVREVSAACLLHLVHNELTGVSRAETLRPWLDLASHIHLDDLHAAVDEQEKILEAAVQAESARERGNALWMVFFGLNRGINLRTFRMIDPAWTEMFSRVANNNLDQMMKVSDLYPTSAGVLAWSGLMTPVEAVQRMREAGLGFGDIFFGEPVVVGTPVPGGPIAQVLLHLVVEDWVSQDEELKKRTVEFSRVLLDEFNSTPVRNWPTNGIAEFASFFYGFQMPGSDHQPTELVDASTLTLLGHAELTGGRAQWTKTGSSRARRAYMSHLRRSGDIEQLKERPMSAPVHTFVEDWLEDRSSVFHRDGAADAEVD